MHTYINLIYHFLLRMKYDNQIIVLSSLKSKKKINLKDINSIPTRVLLSRMNEKEGQILNSLKAFKKYLIQDETDQPI